jgi:hypothetical protein
MLALPDRLVTDVAYEVPFDVNFSYYERAEITGEMTRSGGYFVARFEMHAAGESDWVEREWVIEDLVLLRRGGGSAEPRKSLGPVEVEITRSPVQWAPASQERRTWR